MDKSKSMQIIKWLLVGLFATLIIYFLFAVNVYGKRWFANPYNTRLQKQKNVVESGEILDRNGSRLAVVKDSKRRYNENKDVRIAVSHTVGDTQGLTASGAENIFAKQLLGFDKNVFERIYQLIMSSNNGTSRGSDVMLTIDAKLCEYVAQKMGKNKGAVVLLNYKTGEIYAMVSKPGFDPNNIESYRNIQESGYDPTVLVNRATMGLYPPGSVFKIVTAAAEIRQNPEAMTRTWDSSGPMAFSIENNKYLSDVKITAEQDKALKAIQKKVEKDPDQIVENDEEAEFYTESTNDYNLLRNYNLTYFGEVDLKKAFAKSCNVTFAQIGLELGADKVSKMARNFGIGENFMFNDVVVYKSSYTKSKEDYYLAWSAVGQYKDLVTPMNVALISAAIANDGAMVEPKLLKGIIGSLNYSNYIFKTKVHSHPLTVDEAQKMKELMRACVTEGTGSAAGLKNYKVGGKTGTAEVSENGQIKSHAWFTGYVDDADHPLAIAVVLEKAGTGGSKAAPIAGDIFARAIKLGY